MPTLKEAAQPKAAIVVNKSTSTEDVFPESRVRVSKTMVLKYMILHPVKPLYLLAPSPDTTNAKSRTPLPGTPGDRPGSGIVKEWTMPFGKAGEERKRKGDNRGRTAEKRTGRQRILSKTTLELSPRATESLPTKASNQEEHYTASRNGLSSWNVVILVLDQQDAATTLSQKENFRLKIVNVKSRSDAEIDGGADALLKTIDRTEMEARQTCRFLICAAESTLVVIHRMMTTPGIDSVGRRIEAVFALQVLTAMPHLRPLSMPCASSPELVKTFGKLGRAEPVTCKFYTLSLDYGDTVRGEPMVIRASPDYWSLSRTLFNEAEREVKVKRHDLTLSGFLSKFIDESLRDLSTVHMRLNIDHVHTLFEKGVRAFRDGYPELAEAELKRANEYISLHRDLGPQLSSSISFWKARLLDMELDLNNGKYGQVLKKAMEGPQEYSQHLSCLKAISKSLLGGHHGTLIKELGTVADHHPIVRGCLAHAYAQHGAFGFSRQMLQPDWSSNSSGNIHELSGPYFLAKPALLVLQSKTHRILGNYRKGLGCAQEAKKEILSCYGKNYTGILKLEAMMEISHLTILAQHNFEEAMIVLDATMKAAKDFLDPEHPLIKQVLYVEIVILRHRGCYGRASNKAVKLLEQLERSVSTYELTFDVKLELSILRRLRGDFVDASTLLHEVLEASKEAENVLSVWHIHALQELAQNYFARGLYELGRRTITNTLQLSFEIEGHGCPGLSPILSAGSADGNMASLVKYFDTDNLGANVENLSSHFAFSAQILAEYCLDTFSKELSLRILNFVQRWCFLKFGMAHFETLKATNLLLSCYEGSDSRSFKKLYSNYVLLRQCVGFEHQETLRALRLLLIRNAKRGCWDPEAFECQRSPDEQYDKSPMNAEDLTRETVLNDGNLFNLFVHELEKVWTEQLDTLGVSHPDTVETMCWIGLWYRNLLDPDDALDTLLSDIRAITRDPEARKQRPVVMNRVEECVSILRSRPMAGESSGQPGFSPYMESSSPISIEAEPIVGVSMAEDKTIQLLKV